MSQLSQTRWWHRLSREQQDQELRKAGASEEGYKRFVRIFRQPWWCDYPDGLHGGIMGCWSLSHPNRGDKRCPEDCGNCDCRIGSEEWKRMHGKSILR